MPKIETNGNLVIGDFNGVVDLKNFIEEKEDKEDWETISRCKKRSDWSGNCTYKESKEQLIQGDNSYTTYFIDGLKSLNSEENANASFGFDVEGSCYDIGSVIAGVPECCIRQDYTDSKKYIKIYMGIAFNCGVSHNIIKNRGIAIFNLVNTLTLQGYIVDLCIGDYAHTHTDKNSWMRIHIPSNQLVISTLAFLCTPQFFRILSFLVSDMLTNKPDCDGNANSIKPKDFQKNLEKEGYFYIKDGYDIDNDCELEENYSTVQKAIESISKIFNDYCTRKMKKN